MNVVHLLGLQGPWQRQVFRDTDCLHCRSYGPNRVFFQASYSWQSERFFGQSFSVALPVQALRGFPCLGSFSTVRHVRHIGGPPLAGVLLWSSVVRRLMGQPLYFQLPMLACGEREAMVMATPHTHDSALLPCFHGCPAFLHRHFPSQSPPSHPLDCSFHSQQQPLPRDCSTIPKLQLPAVVPSRGPVSLSRVRMAATRTV